MDKTEIKLRPTHEAADAFWKYWRENGDTHKHGYYESTWGAINAAIEVCGVCDLAGNSLARADFKIDTRKAEVDEIVARFKAEFPDLEVVEGDYGNTTSVRRPGKQPYYITKDRDILHPTKKDKGGDPLIIGTSAFSLTPEHGVDILIEKLRGNLSEFTPDPLLDHSRPEPTAEKLPPALDPAGTAEDEPVDLDKIDHTLSMPAAEQLTGDEEPLIDDHTHINADGEFQSDKLPGIPPGWFPMKFTDLLARMCIRMYATFTTDDRLAIELLTALAKGDDDARKSAEEQGERPSGDQPLEPPS